MFIELLQILQWGPLSHEPVVCKTRLQNKTCCSRRRKGVAKRMRWANCMCPEKMSLDGKMDRCVMCCCGLYLICGSRWYLTQVFFFSLFFFLSCSSGSGGLGSLVFHRNHSELFATYSSITQATTTTADRWPFFFSLSLSFFFLKENFWKMKMPWSYSRTSDCASDYYFFV